MRLRGAALAAMAVSATVALSGCAAIPFVARAGDTERRASAPTSAPAGPATSSPASATSAPTSDALPSPTSSTPSTVGPDPANPTPLPKVTPPGARVAIGDPIVVKIPSSIDSANNGMKTGWAYVQVSVTSVKKGDQKVLGKIRDLKEFKGGSVWYMRGRMKVLALSGEGRKSILSVAIAGVQDNGKVGAGTFGIGTLAPECDDGFVLSEAKVGHVQQVCDIMLARPGHRIVGAAFYRDGTLTSWNTSDDPYVAKPVVWMP
ncbi:hypothetical protein ACQP1U_05640 [Actinomycetota bacterium]